MIKENIQNEDLLKSLNSKIEEISKMKHYMSSDEFLEYSDKKQLNHIAEIKNKTKNLEKLNNRINKIMSLSYAGELSNKVYLSEIVEKENIQFGRNNLILAPTGSGKTTLIRNVLIENIEQNVLMLVSNESLKSQLAPSNDEERKYVGNRMFTSQNNSVYGEGNYKIHLMTYAEFGERMYVNDSFWKDIHQVFCDEIHSLPEYIKYGSDSNGGLIHAQRLLFNKYKDKEIFYFTATDFNLIEMENDRPGTMNVVKTFDFRKHENIMKFVPVVSREITHINQIKQYLEDRSTGFKYYNYKGIAFSKRISSLKKIEEIVTDEGFNPLVLWSTNNEENKLSEEQVRAKDELLKTNKIPEPYDFLIYNSAYQEGWDLKDNSVKLAIMNTTNETEYIQALGRLRRDVDLLVYRTNDKTKENKISISEKFINKPLTSKDKEKLTKELNLIGSKGQRLSWRGVKPVIVKSGYIVEEKVERVNEKTIKVSIITNPSKQE